jgi:hypothetical protein
MSDIVDSFSEEETLLSTFKDNNFHIYYLICLDSSSNTHQYNHAQKSLGFFIDHFEIFNESDPCEQYIQSTSDDLRIILILNENLGEQLIPRIHQLRQIYSIYIFSINIEYHQNWTKQYKKVSNESHFKEIFNIFLDIFY